MPREPTATTKQPRDRQSGRRPSDRRRSLPPLTAIEPGGAPPDIPTEHLDPDALSVVHRLRSFGHQSYLVGGCVRDLLLGIRPKDFDVATSAHPGEIRAVFRNCRLIGRRFRLAHVYFRGGKVVETATFRANPNGEVIGGDLLITRDNVFGTAEEDARRRDFTINGLFYDVVLGKVLDFVGGKADLEHRLLRTIGDPDVRIQEDPVRLLRAVRFAAKLDLEIEPKTWDALVRHKSGLARCAPPRVLEEIFRLLRSGHSEQCLQLLLRLDALDILLPPLAAHIRESAESERKGFFDSLKILDEVVRSGRLPDDSILLACLLVHLAMDEGQGRAEAGQESGTQEAEEEEEDSHEALAIEGLPEEARDGSEDEAAAEEAEAEVPVIPWAVSASAASVEDLLRELARSARLPRRIAERSSVLLRTLKVLSGERRRRGSPMRLVRQDHFSDSLFVYWLWVRATGTDPESLDRWLARAEQAGVYLPWLDTGDEAEPAEKEAAPAEETRREAQEVAPAPVSAREKRRGRHGRERQASKQEEKESLPPEHERRPPPGPVDFLPF